MNIPSLWYYYLSSILLSDFSSVLCPRRISLGCLSYPSKAPLLKQHLSLHQEPSFLNEKELELGRIEGSPFTLRSMREKRASITSARKSSSLAGLQICSSKCRDIPVISQKIDTRKHNIWFGTRPRSSPSKRLDTSRNERPKFFSNGVGDLYL